MIASSSTTPTITPPVSSAATMNGRRKRRRRRRRERELAASVLSALLATTALLLLLVLLAAASIGVGVAGVGAAAAFLPNHREARAFRGAAVRYYGGKNTVPSSSSSSSSSHRQQRRRQRRPAAAAVLVPRVVLFSAGSSSRSDHKNSSVIGGSSNAALSTTGNNNDDVGASKSTTAKNKEMKEYGKRRRRRQQRSSNVVIYQKVVRAPTGTTGTNASCGDGTSFLASLVRYLQEQFRLPEGRHVPVPYEASSSSSDNHLENEDEDEDRGVLARWDSPLSPCPDLTALYVEVVGIYAAASSDANAGAGANDNDSDNDSTRSTTTTTRSPPTMAMVVVRKKKASVSSSTTTMPPMLQNLFRDSEKRILRALDDGLDGFVAAGRFDVVADDEDDGGNGNGNRDKSNNKNNWQENTEALLAEVMADDDDDDAGAGVDNGPNGRIEKSTSNAIDAVVSRVVAKNDDDDTIRLDDSDSRERQKLRAGGAADFAVAAAAAKAKAVASRAKGSSETENGSGAPNDYAVQAAQRAARARRDRRSNSSDPMKKKKSNGGENRATKDDSIAASERPKVATTAAAAAASAAEGAEQIDLSAIRPPMLDPSNSKPRAFMQTISRPSNYRAAKSTKEKKIKSVRQETIGNNSSKEGSGNTATDTDNGVKAQAETVSRGDIQSGRKLNVRKQESKFPSDEEVDELEREIMKQTQDTLSELASETPDLTPEELLENVMKFGEERQREESVGGAFVSGAFDKAKELLREQNQKREEKLRQNVVDKVSMDFKNQEVKPEAVVKELSPDEEIRRMFEAGERIAEGRIAVVDDRTGTGAMSEDDERMVDSLISGEKSVSNHARVLDEELAELEVRINKSPGEELDGRRKNGIFDVFSGPEVYNRNVDAETAVNWPGALPGTRDGALLPKELEEAVRQANFAAEVLSKLEVREEEGERGTGKSYFFGARELSVEQVENLRTVMKEGVEIGLIDDPLRVMAEVSRLQMLLDELWDQPEERVREISSNYKDLLLSDYFVPSVKRRLSEMAERDLDALRHDDDSLEERHAKERELLGTLVGYAQLLLKEARALGAELEAQQLEVIRSICKVAMNPSHSTEEDTAVALSDAVRDMRPLLDDSFVAYLKYAVAEEEGRLARAGLLGDPEHSHWLMVLQVVQQGVYNELARGINRYIDHIWYVLRMETPTERRMLLEKLIDVMPSLDVKPFVQVVENIAGSLGDGVSGDFGGVTALGEMTNKILQLRRDVKELLPPERIALMSRDADEWTERQKKRLKEQRKSTQQRLQSSRIIEETAP